MGLIWRVGNGNLVKVWGSKWVPIPTTYEIQTPLRIIAPDSSVSVLIDRDQNWWKHQLVKEIFSEEEAKAILSIPIGGTNRPHTLIWRGMAFGMFTVRSAYHLAKELSM
jgi:hypothetical protein